MRAFLKPIVIIVLCVIGKIFWICGIVCLACFFPLIPVVDCNTKITEVHLHRIMVEDSVQSDNRYYWMDVYTKPVNQHLKFVKLFEQIYVGLISECENISAYNNKNEKITTLGGVQNLRLRTIRLFSLTNGNLSSCQKLSGEDCDNIYLFHSYDELSAIISDINSTFYYSKTQGNSWILRTSSNEEMNSLVLEFKEGEKLKCELSDTIIGKIIYKEN